MTRPHEVLQIEPDATPAEIKKAFLRRSRTEHPDAGGTKERFVRLLEAYESMLEAAESGNTGATPEPKPVEPDSAEQASYEEQVRAVWEAAQAYRRATVPVGKQPNQTLALWIALLATPLSAALIAGCFAWDGSRFYPDLWSFLFCAVMVVIIWSCVLAAVVGSSVVRRNTLATYNRLLLTISLMTLLFIGYPVFADPAQPGGPVHYSSSLGTSRLPARPAALQFVPRWWPMRNECWNVNLSLSGR